MEHLHFEFDASAGKRIAVKLNTQAFVRLMDPLNYTMYQSGGRYTYYGGLAVRTPAPLTIPHAGHWHVAIDLNGHSGYVQAEIVG